MSTYSDAWHRSPPALQSFYHNFARQFTYFSPKDPSLGFPGAYLHLDWLHFWMKGQLGFHIAQRNWTVQSAWFGSFSTDLVLMFPHWSWSDPDPGPVQDALALHSWGHFFIDGPGADAGYPRPKRKARRTYWYGKPKKRRNL